MTINEMIKNVNALAIPGLEVPLAITVDEINEAVRNAMYERFVSTVEAFGEVCGLSAIWNTKEFAVDFIKSNDYVEKCLRATTNLVLNGGFSNKSALDGFINRLLYSPAVEAIHEEIDNSVPCYDDDDDDYDYDYDEDCYPSLDNSVSDYVDDDDDDDE